MDSLSPISPTSLSDDDHDAFLGFVEYARSSLSSSSAANGDDNGGDGDPPPWSWVVSRILKTCVAYSSGVTAAILLSDLFQVELTLSLSPFAFKFPNFLPQSFRFFLFVPDISVLIYFGRLGTSSGSI